MPLLFAGVIEARLPFPGDFALYPGPLVEAAFYGVLTALLFTLWPLARTETGAGGGAVSRRAGQRRLAALALSGWRWRCWRRC